MMALSRNAGYKFGILLLGIGVNILVGGERLGLAWNLIIVGAGLIVAAIANIDGKKDGDTL